VLAASLPASLPPIGSRVVLSVRPESIRINNVPASTYSAVLVDATYLGDIAHYTLSLGDDERIRCSVINPGVRHEAIQNGATFAIEADPSDVIVVADD